MFVLALLGAVALVMPLLVLRGIVPLHWVCQPGEALYWASWFECLPFVGAVAAHICKMAQQELIRVGFRSVCDAKKLCPLGPDAEGEICRREEALEACRRGIAHLEGPWHDQRFPPEIAVLLEQLRLHAARLCLQGGAKQRGREHYCYAKEVAIDVDSSSADADPGAPRAPRNCGAPVALASCSSLFKHLAGDGHFGDMASLADELTLLRGVVAVELLAASESSPALRAWAEHDVIRLEALSKRHARAREFLASRSASLPTCFSCSTDRGLVPPLRH